MKKINKKISKKAQAKIKLAIKIILILMISGIILFGLVIAPYIQLKITSNNLLVNSQIFKLDEIKDIRRCESFSRQELNNFLNIKNKENKIVTGEEKNVFINEINKKCLTQEAREYLFSGVKAENI